MKEIRKNFLSNISVAKKSFILLLVTTVGLLFVGILEYIGLYSIKHGLQTSYTHHTQAIEHIQELSNVYNITIQKHLKTYQDNKTDTNHTLLNLQEDILHTSKLWNIIKNNQPTNSNTIKKEIKEINSLLTNTLKYLDSNRSTTIQNKDIKNYQNYLLSFNQKAASILTKHHKQLQIEAKEIDKHYYATLITTIIFIIILLVISIILAYSIYKDIKKLIFNLSEIVEKKTKDYQELALQLEYKVNKEVIKNREKDQIMYQHARLAAMGEMIGNIAHQWRQPLNALTVLIQSFGIKSMSGNLNQEFIDKQVDEGLRLANQMSNTIEDFKNFFSPHKDREYFGIVETLRETLELVEFFCKDEHIDIKLIAKDEIRVYGYSNEFSQVILNLLNNARDNFKQKDIQKNRKIVIKVEKKHKPEPFVMISFIDNGGGIDTHIIDRIFEPYFTTKHKSTGTGIGLYMSKQIIEKQMHGLVTMKNITSKLGTKTTYQCAQFIIAIPIK